MHRFLMKLCNNSGWEADAKEEVMRSNKRYNEPRLGLISNEMETLEPEKLKVICVN